MKLFGAGKPDHPMVERKAAIRLLEELPTQELKALDELAHWFGSLAAAPGFRPEEERERRRFRRMAPLAKSDWLKVGALVAAQPEGASWLVGTVRRVSKVSKDEIRVGVETLSRAPAVSRFALKGSQPSSGVLLPLQSGDAAVALRAGVYTHGENLESTIGGRARVYLPQGSGERGEDYEIVRFRELVKEP